MEVIGSIYTGVSDNFQGGVYPIARCVKAENHDLGVVLMEQRRLGNLYGDDRGTGFAGNVWDKNYISPSLTTMQGGMREPMIVDKQIVAMCGRNPDNPSDRTAGSQTEQRLEMNMQDTSNCLTSVQKDNLVLENVIAIDEQNLSIRTETVGTLTTDGSSHKHNNRVMIKQATKQGYIECEVGGVADFSYPDSETRRGRVQDNGKTCPTLTAESQDICRIEMLEKPVLLGGVGEENEFGTQYRQGNRVYSSNAVAMCLNSQPVGNTGGNSYLYNVNYRIRKLTPRECWRLMDFSDEDFEKAEEVNSNTQLYKQAGNSIVKNVLIAIFGQMIPGKGMCYLRDECE